MTLDIETRIEQRARALAESAERASMRISGDGRVSESCANVLLGFDGADTLKKLREYRRGPTFHRVGVNGSRISYTFVDLAIWIESLRVEQGINEDQRG